MPNRSFHAPDSTIGRDGPALAAQFLKLRCRDELTAAEAEALERACDGRRRFDAGACIVPARKPQSTSNLLVAGYVARQVMLPDGRRQIVCIHVPGDFVDLHSFLLKELEHDVVALTPVEIALFPHDRLRRITEHEPHLTRMLWLSTLLDAALHREWVLSVGQRTARERVAHLVCELYERLKLVGLVEAMTFPLPLTQADLADATGLTAVHVNRTLRSLREAGLLEVRSRRATVLDYDGLVEAAAFDPYYLHQRLADR